MEFKEYLEKKEVVDLFLIGLLTVFSITLVYQITFIQSEQADLYRLGILAVGLGMLTFVGFGLLFLTSFVGIVDSVNFRKGEIKDFSGLKGKRSSLSIKDIIKKDETFTHDYTTIFFWALVFQVGFALIYGGFAGSIFNLNFDWDVNTLIIPINSAVAEEIFFSLFLTAFLLSICKEKWHVGIVLVINIFAFLLFHTLVYGTDPRAALYIVVLRVLYFVVYFLTRRASIPVLLHALNNFMFVSTILFI